MVSRIIISIALICSSVAMSQGLELELNRVITNDTTYTLTVPGGPYNFYSAEYTVPEGKIWKVEYLSGYSFLVNGTYIDNSNKNPFWLNSGDRIQHKKNGLNPYSLQDITVEYFMSILEFNTD